MRGSNDPLLEWALRQSGSGLAVRVAGSTQGLEELASGRAVLAGCHLMDPESGTWNLPAVRAHLPGGAHVVIHWARRVQGLITAPDNPLAITGIADAAKRGLRFAIRSEGAGSQRLLDLLLTRDGPVGERPQHCRTDRSRPMQTSPPSSPRARPIAGSDSRPLPDNSDSSPSSRTRASISSWRAGTISSRPYKALLAFARSEGLMRRAAYLGGYDLSDHGKVRWNG